MNNVQKLRKLYKMTQNDVSELINYPKPLYTAFERGDMKLPGDKINILCNYYNVTADYLLKDMDI